MTLTAADKAAFLTAVRQDGVDPTEQCPVCRSRKLQHAARKHTWCGVHLDWNDNIIPVHCRSCRRTWEVIRRPQCCAAPAPADQVPA